MGNLNSLRALNRATILKQILQVGDASRTEVAEQTGISKVAVTSIVNDLLKEGFLVEEGYSEGSAGRPAQKVHINPHLGWVLGIDVQPDELRYGSSNIRGQSFQVQDMPVQHPSHVTERVLACIEENVRQHPNNPLKYLCLGLAAPVDGQGQPYVPNGLPELDLRQVKAQCDRLGTRLILENDANLAAMAEQEIGAIQGERNFLVLLRRRPSGIGMGLFQNGQLCRGERGLAGEISLVKWSVGTQVMSIEDLDPENQEVALANVISALGVSLDLNAIVIYESPLIPETSQLKSRVRALLPQRIGVLDSKLGRDATAAGALVRAVEALHLDLLAWPEF